MVASLFGIGGATVLPVSSGLAEERFSPAAGQTVFNLSTFSYVQETNSLWVFVNGKKLETGIQYVETSGSSFTLNTASQAGDQVEVVGFPVQAVTVIDNTIFHSFPFYTSLGVMNNIPLNSTGKLPFYFANLTYSPIPII